MLSTLAARFVCFFIFFPLEEVVEHLFPLQQGQLSNMNPAIPKMMKPRAMRRLRLPIKLERSNLSIPMAKAEEAHAAKINPKEEIEDI